MWKRMKSSFISLIAVLSFSACSSEHAVPSPTARDGSSNGDPTARSVESFENQITPSDTSVTASLDPAAVEKGHEAFYTYGCWHCHTLGDEEAPGMRDFLNSGPDLAEIGSRLSKEAILQSILDPNAVITEPKEDHTENGLSKMPSFNDPMAMDDIRNIVQFLVQNKAATTVTNNIVEVTDADFENQLKEADGLVLLDFWAEWCFACLEANPALEQIAPKFEGQLNVFKIEVDENPVLVNRYVPDLMFPCFVILRDGELLDRKYGLNESMDAKVFFETWIGKHLNKDD